ncbi:MAG: VWA domain-containing protein [Armatimonadota bacterium]|nr:VWA domain-containing protein [Armatimonadota bacterium]MDR5697619.1 VWA domain-containing protein [Armatimonadota bacterium]
MIRFEAPWALILLVLLPVLWRAARAARTPPRYLPLRLAAVALVVGALAGPQVVARSPRLTVVFALDRSDSIDANQAATAERFVAEAAAARRPGDRVGLVTFGGTAVVEQAPSDSFDPRPSQRPRPMETDIGAAIDAAVGALPPTGGRRIVVISDGLDHGGRALEAARSAWAAGIEVSVVPLPRRRTREVLAEEIVVPPQVRAGERFVARVLVRSNWGQMAEVELRAQGEVIRRRRAHVPVGLSAVAFPVQARSGGWLELVATVIPDRDTVWENNRAQAVVRVAGPPSVLYVGQGGLPEVLRAQGLGVRRTSAERLPARPSALAGYDAVVLEDVTATVLSRAQMEALRDYVRDLGGGLVAVGGPRSYGVGGYAKTPLEEALPVTMDVRHRVALPSMAIVLVLDTSGSMAGLGAETAKVELAKETAQSVIDLLAERDLIGVIQFDQEYRWLVPLTEARHRERIIDQVARLRAGGGTNMWPPLAGAREALAGVDVKVKHVIVLSDGHTDPGDFERLARQMRSERMTVSTVSVGKDADVKFMTSLAAWGGGRHYVARDVYSIPQIFVAEAMVATRAYLVEERFVPRREATDLLAGLGEVPALRGYVATSPKPSAEVHLRSAQRDPILATWRYGLGRAVAFTSDAVPRWSVEWHRWREFARFWSRTVRWTMRPVGGTLDVHTAWEGASLHVAVDARDADGDYLDGLSVGAVVAGREATALHLRQTGPGWYEGRVPLDGPGLYALAVTARSGPRVIATETLPVVLSYSPELRDVGADGSLLARIAEVGGGSVLLRPADAMRRARAGRDVRETWPLLATAALGLFLLEVAARRLPVVGAVVGAAVLRLRRRLASPQADAEYAQADRWMVPGAQGRSDASGEELARLYIARLKQTRR